jgi:hypothetical protein
MSFAATTDRHPRHRQQIDKPLSSTKNWQRIEQLRTTE